MQITTTSPTTRPTRFGEQRKRKRLIFNLAAITGAMLALVIGSHASAGVLSPYKATYSVERGGMGLGTARFTLSDWSNPGADGHCLRYHGVARPRALIRWLIGDITDDSRFCVTDDDRIISHAFSHTEAGNDEDSHRLDFDPAAGQVTYHGSEAAGGSKQMALPDQALDLANLHIAARLWLASLDNPANSEAAAEREFTIVDEDEIKHYRLATRPGKRLKTPLGKLDTVVLQRVDDDKRKLVFWAAPALDYLPIRVVSQKGDDPAIRMDIKTLKRQINSDNGDGK